MSAHAPRIDVGADGVTIPGALCGAPDSGVAEPVTCETCLEIRRLLDLGARDHRSRLSTAKVLDAALPLAMEQGSQLRDAVRADEETTRLAHEIAMRMYLGAVLGLDGERMAELEEDVRQYGERAKTVMVDKSERYPLWCVSFHNGEGVEHELADNEEHAHEMAAERLRELGGGEAARFVKVKRCRQVRASECQLELLDDVVERVDQEAAEGAVGHAWGDYDHPLATIAASDRASVEAAFLAFIDRHIRVALYVCEGDDELWAEEKDGPIQ